ncbi:MAG: hypothetical protein MJY99_08220 [Fibrobacter sp.]|nr:hypothetical protein [Fibrobacter sp.]
MKLNFGGIARLACCVAAGGLLMLVGCAGFTEDTNTVQSAKENEDRYAEAFDLASAYLTGSVKVDENKNKLTIDFDESDFGYDSLACDYEFSGDTLLLSYVDKKDGKKNVERTKILLGGKSQRLDGVWMESECSLENAELACEENADTLYWKFEGDEVEIRIVPSENTYSADSESASSSSGKAPASSSDTGTEPKSCSSGTSSHLPAVALQVTMKIGEHLPQQQRSQLRIVWPPLYLVCGDRFRRLG